MTQIGGIIGGIIGAVALAALAYGIFQYKYSRRPFTHVPKNSKFLDPEYNAGIRSGLNERHTPTTHGVPTVVNNNSTYPQQQTQTQTHPAYAPPYESGYESQPAADLQRPEPVHGGGLPLGGGPEMAGMNYDNKDSSRL